MEHTDRKEVLARLAVIRGLNLGPEAALEQELWVVQDLPAADALKYLMLRIKGVIEEWSRGDGEEITDIRATRGRLRELDHLALAALHLLEPPTLQMRIMQGVVFAIPALFLVGVGALIARVVGG